MRDEDPIAAPQASDDRHPEPRPTAPQDAARADTGVHDPIEALRTELVSIDELPVPERLARFEHANGVLAAALAELDEV